MLRIQISQPQPMVMDNAYDIVQRDTLMATALLISGVLLQHAKEPCLKPALIDASVVAKTGPHVSGSPGMS